MRPSALPALFGSILRLRGTSTPLVGTPNGIAELKQVDLNGYPQWVLIRGHDVSDPLFLFLHGGPGESNLWLAHHTMKELERHFVCVNWDQRGAGKSLLPGPEPASMTIDQLYADTVALIGQLLARFEKEKLLLLGHSWGGLLATRVAARHPELLYGVILMNPTIDSRRGEELSYDWALERSRDAHDEKAVRTLERLGGSDTYGQDGRFIERQVVFRHGGLVHSDPKRMVRIMLEAPEYSIADCIRAFRMKSLSFSIPLMADELMKINLIEEVPRLAVPVFFFLGRHDHTAPTELSGEFHSSLRAPYKEVVWFEESAHTPDLDESEKFQREIIRIGQELCRSEPLLMPEWCSGRAARPPRRTRQPVSALDTSVSSRDTSVSTADTPVSAADTPVSSLDTCVSSPHTSVSGADTPVSPVDTPVSGPAPPVSPPDTFVSAADTSVSTVDTLGGGRRALARDAARALGAAYRGGVV